MFIMEINALLQSERKSYMVLQLWIWHAFIFNLFYCGTSIKIQYGLKDSR